MQDNFESEKLKISLKPEDMVGKFDVDEVNKKESVQEKAKRELIENLQRGYIYYREDSLENVDNVRPEPEEDENDNYNDYDSDGDWDRPDANIPIEVIRSPEVQEAARSGVAICLLDGNVHGAIKIKDNFSLHAEVITSPEQMEAIDAEIVRRGKSGDIEGVEEIIVKFFSTDINENGTPFKFPRAEKVLKKILVNLLSNGYIDRAIQIKEKFPLPGEVITSPEVRKVVGEKILDLLTEDYFNFERVTRLKDIFSFSTEDLNKIGKMAMLCHLSEKGRRYHDALKIKEELKLPEDVLLSPEIQSAAKGKVSRLLSNGNVEGANDVIKKFSLPVSVFSSPDIQQGAKSAIIICLSEAEYSRIDEAINIKKIFSVSNETLALPEVQEAAERAMTRQLLERSYNYIDRAMVIKGEFLLSPENVQESARQGVKNCLLAGSVDNAIKIRDAFSISVDSIFSSEIHDAAKAGIIKCLSKGEVDSAIKIKDQFPIHSEFFLSTEIKKAAMDQIVSYLSGGRFDNNWLNHIKIIRDNFSVPAEFMFSSEVQNAARDRMIKCLLKRDINFAIEIKNGIPLLAETILSPEAQDALRTFISDRLSSGRVDEVDKIQKQFIVTPEHMQQAAKEGMIVCLNKGDAIMASGIKTRFSFAPEIISSIEIQEATKKGVAKCLADGKVEHALEMCEKFLLPIDVMIQTAKEKIIIYFSAGKSKNDFDIALKIMDGFPLPQNIISSQEVQDAAKKGMLSWISNVSVDHEHYFVRVKEIIDRFSLPTDIISSLEVQEAAKNRMTKCLSEGLINQAVKIQNGFSLSMSNVAIAATEGMLARLTNTSRKDKLIGDAIEIKDNFSLSTEVCRKVAKEAMAQQLEIGGIDYAIKIQEQFALSDGDISEASKKAFLKCLAENKTEMSEIIREKFKVSVNSEDIFNVIPEMRTLVSALRNISTEFAAQAEKTPDLLLSLLEFRSDPSRILNVVNENPFLLDAIANNPRFGSRLLVKYQQFDSVAKENIKTQFACKKRIMLEHPEIDPQSVEFRTLMQESMMGFGKNKEVVGAIDEKGINSERWLNYGETAYFNLGSSENVLAFSEIITTPIARIRETIDTYAYTIKEVLSEYRNELIAFEIKLGSSEVPTEELKKMADALEKAKAEGNTKKVIGIEKGIENLKSKSIQERKGVLWEKLLADVASFQRLKDDVFKSQEIFIATEKDLEESLAEKIPSGKAIQDIKRKIAAAKEDLRSKFLIMERRIEDFRANLKNMIVPALGGDRSDALIQDINTRLAEQFNHFDADRSMLKNLFSLQSNKTREEMESRPMTIFVWTRDPDVDLYQGNYSPCCICIDSSYHGAESPIADYNTDLGIQVVNIWDETRNEPVTAAWCWVGEDEEGKPALVVDNIESNTLFSSNFSEQLTKELFKYLEGYAKAVGVKKIVLGKANNDMPTAGELSKMTDNEGKYKKIGGANRSDGYFLEAEDVSVKIVWEKGKKVKTKEEDGGKKKSDKERIAFSEINIQALTEEDFHSVRDLERRVYADNAELIQGQEIVRDIKEGNGLEYSVVILGMAPGSTKEEMIGYAIVVEDETDEGDKSIYLEDIAVAPEAQRQGVGWKLIQAVVERLQEKASSEGKPVLFDMHLRPSSLSMLDAHQEAFVGMGIVLIEEALVPDYYDEGEDAVYRVYEVSPSRV